VGGYTREGGKHFYVREEFADEGKKHAGLILAGLGEAYGRVNPAGDVVVVPQLWMLPHGCAHAVTGTESGK
jgi:hypothetical protein